MKSPKEVKKWVSSQRSRRGKKKNGVVPWLFDAPSIEMKLENSKKNYKRQDFRGFE